MKNGSFSCRDTNIRTNRAVFYRDFPPHLIGSAELRMNYGWLNRPGQYLNWSMRPQKAVLVAPL